MTEALNFVRPLIGLERFERLELEPIGDAPGLFSLRASDDLRLYVIDADLHLPDYHPAFTAEQLAPLGIDTDAEPIAARLLVIVTPAAAKSTVNLAAPIIVNAETGAAGQFILDGEEWPLRYSLAA